MIAAEAPHLAWKNRRLPLSPRSIAVRYLRRRHEAGQRRLVVRELDRSEAYFTEPAKLPGGYGAGANERIVEIPWVLARRPTGRVLDAGSSLNHVEYLDRLEPLVDELQIATLAFEGTAYPDRGISYVYGDLRELPYRDGYFDTVISISTLEHVGMDNTAYGGSSPRADNPAHETEQAVAELARVVRDGGRLLLSVPYGRREDHGWFRQLDRADVEQLVAAARPSEVEIAVYRAFDTGWQLSDLDAASDARYRAGFAAEAVACIDMAC